MSEFGYIPDSSVEQKPFSNKGIFSPTDIYNLDQVDKWTQFGQLELIETKTGSGVAQVDFTDIKATEYDIHFLTINDFRVATDGQTCAIRLRNAGSSSFVTAGNQWANQTGRDAGTFAENRSTSSTYIEIARLLGNDNNATLGGYVYFYGLGNGAEYNYTNHMTSYGNEFSKEYMFSFGGGHNNVPTQTDAIRLTTTSGNISVAEASLYGIKVYK
tara:strand:- start:66 stop:710 length:645 start_codon:yes stop_codon:yes gene_type:complete